MSQVTVKLSLVLILMVHGVLGSETTILVSVGTSATVQCKWNEELMRCSCSSPLHKCTDCTNLQPVTAPLEINTNISEKYLTFIGLQMSTSGLYACSPKTTYDKGVTRKYRINVTKDRDPTVMIGTLGDDTELTCGAGLDLFAASEKKWCRLDNSAVCEENTIMGPNRIKGYFTARNTENFFILEIQNLTHGTAGWYKCTLDFPDQNQTQVNVVNLQVIDSPTLLKIDPVQVSPKGGQPFEITCPYPQELKFGFSKSWKCDHRDCPETVKSTDDHFRSALVLTIDHITCSKIRSFQCVMNSSRSTKYSNNYLHPLMIARSTVVNFYHEMYQKVVVDAYTVLNMVCHKPFYVYDYDFRGYWGRRPHPYNPTYTQGTATICKKIQRLCVDVKVEDKPQVVEFKLCVTPEDNGTVYQCQRGYNRYQLTIYVKEHQPPPIHHENPPTTKQSINSNVIILVVVTTIILLMLTFSIGVNQCKTRSLRQWHRALFARRAPLSAVDAHATMYANAIAEYYSQQRNALAPPTTPAGGNIEERSSSSDDEFEEVPVPQNPSLNINKDKNEYVMVKLLEPGAGPSGGRVQVEAERDEDRDDDITYTPVIIQPKTPKHK